MRFATICGFLTGLLLLVSGRAFAHGIPSCDGDIICGIVLSAAFLTVPIIVIGGGLLILVVVLFGPIYMARPSRKHREKIESASPRRKKFYKWLHWTAGITIAVLCAVMLLMPVFG